MSCVQSLHPHYFSVGVEQESQYGYVVFSGEHPERVQDCSILHDLPLDRVLIAGDLYARIGVTQTPTMVFLQRSERYVALGKSSLHNWSFFFEGTPQECSIRVASSDLQ